MFAVVRTGGKQYRVALGDKIVVEKLAGDAGQRIDITDVLLAGEGSELKSVKGLTVAAEIIAQAKGDKVTVFKKRRRHNYRRKKGHRQQHTILRIVAIGDQKHEPAKAEKGVAKKPTGPKPGGAPKVDEQPTSNPAPSDEAAANPSEPIADSGKDAAPKKAAAAKAAKPAKPAKAAKPASTRNAAPAKGADQKSAKPKSTKSKAPKGK